MIDFGLLLSAIVAIGLPTLLASRWGFDDPARSASFLDVAVGPLLLGLAVARIAAMLFEDPQSLSRISDVAIIRSGVDFWPGVVAATGLFLFSARRAGVAPLGQLAAVVPLAMVGAAGYEATCVVRDGCFGPVSAIGMRPPGVATTMLPIGWLMAIALGVGAEVLRRQRHQHDPLVTIAAGACVVALIRATGSFWLPHLGQGLTRAHWTSIGVAGAAALGCLALLRAEGSIERDEGRRRPPHERADGR